TRHAGTIGATFPKEKKKMKQFSAKSFLMVLFCVVVVKKLLSFRSRYTVLTSKEDVKVDGERIHIG
ncbi:MAG: DUF3540 domain-containing protein, partial [Desulfosarcinaceae bacterium]